MSAGKTDGDGCSSVILLGCVIWFWWIGGCTYIKDVVKDHNHARTSAAGSGPAAGQAQPERDAGK